MRSSAADYLPLSVRTIRDESGYVDAAGDAVALAELDRRHWDQIDTVLLKIAGSVPFRWRA